MKIQGYHRENKQVTDLCITAKEIAERAATRNIAPATNNQLNYVSVMLTGQPLSRSKDGDLLWSKLYYLGRTEYQGSDMGFFDASKDTRNIKFGYNFTPIWAR